MYEIQNYFSKSHKSILNCILHFLILGVRLSSFFSLVESVIKNSSFILSFLYCLWLYNNIPPDIWLPSTIYTFISWLSKSWFNYYSSIIAIILSFVLQFFSNYFTEEIILQSEDKNNKDSIFKIIHHTIYFIPLMIDRGKYMMYGIAKFFTNQNKIIKSKITKIEDLESINNWINSQNKDHISHWSYNKLPDKVQKMFEKIANSPEVNDSYRKLNPSSSWMLRRITSMDEIYIKNYNSNDESYNNYFIRFPLFSIIRTIVAINQNDSIYNKFYNNQNKYTLDKGDIISFNFNKKLHYLDINKGSTFKDYQIILKINVITGPKILFPLVNLLVKLNTIYSKIFSNLFTSNPKTIFQKLFRHSIIIFSNFNKNIEVKLAYSNIIWFISSLLISYIFNNQIFILLTSYIHYIKYISNYFVKNNISFYEFKRDYSFWKIIAFGQLFLYYSINLKSLLLIIIGGGLSVYYFDEELSIIKSTTNESFLPSIKNYLLVLGNYVLIFGISLGLKSQFIWIVNIHLLLYLTRDLQKYYDIHYANSGYLIENYNLENLKTNSRFIKTNRGSILHYILEMKNEYNQLIVVIAGHGGHANSDLLVNNNRHLYFENNIGYCGIDLEGQGISSGIRANYSDLLNSTSHDVSLILNELKQRYSNIKIILTGFSLGGGVALKVALTYPNLVDKLILQNPYFKINKDIEPSTIKNFYLHLMAHILPYSLLPFPEKLLKNYNEDFYQKFLDDPLCWCGSMRFSTVCSAQKLSKWNISNIYKLEIPTLVQLSLNDQLLCPSFSKSIFNNLKTVKIKEYENARHDYFETKKISQIFIDDGIKWIKNSLVDNKINI